MGQFLSIGIVTVCGVSKKELQKQNIIKDELIAEMQKRLYFEPSIYNFLETEESYLFHLQTTVLENYLLPFLEKLYPFLYLGRGEEFKQTLEMLRNTAPSQWLALAERKSQEEFQIDKYGENEYLYFNKPSRARIGVFSTTILLSLEGKIMMEEYGRQFNFFRYCIQQTFSEFPIAKAIRVYISG
jgi:hypothetical protein